MQPYIRPAQPADVEYIARRMKPADVAEVLASHGASPLEAMEHCFESSPTMRGTVCAADGEPVLMYGVAPYVPPDTGCPWMISTDLIHRPDMRRFFLRGTAAVVQRMHRNYPILIQHVDARHTHSVRWMLWSGFSIDKLDPEFGVGRIPFFRFSKVQPCALPQPSP
jgi:hypothetical protein